jgi:phosphate transport system ATP-binding protein
MADDATFFLQEELVETGECKKLFIAPEDKRTQDYVKGRFG